MTTFFTIISIAILYGTYDLFIKLAAGRINPALGAMITQIASAFALILYTGLNTLLRSDNAQVKIAPLGIFFVILAGITIAAALILLFTLLQNKEIKATTAFPTILILRNVTLVTLGILVLGEKLSITKSFGIGLSLIGIYLISL